MEHRTVTGQEVIQCWCQCRVENLTDTLHLFTTQLQNLRVGMATVIEIRVWKNAAQITANTGVFPWHCREHSVRVIR
jgi:hypothetical protein